MSVPVHSRLAPASRIVLVTPGLAAGGTERVVSIMANWWAAAGHHVSIVTLDGPDASPFFPLDPRIELARLDVAGVTTGRWDAVAGNVARVRVMRRALAARPGFLISFIAQTNLIVLLATGLGRRPVVIAERTDPSQAPLPRIWSRLRRVLYRRAAVVVVQTERVRALIAQTTGAHTVVIPNPVTTPTGAALDAAGVETLAVTHEADATIAGPDFISVGRFSVEKGFDLLLRAFAAMPAREGAPRLRIVGDGPLRADLEALARTLGVAARVEWLGQRTDVATLLGRGDIYVLPSRFEGFPNVLCEAMAAGAPVVAFDCRSGPADIIAHGEDGLLVPAEDVPGLAAAMQQVRDDRLLRQKLSHRARAVATRLAPGRVMPLWESVLLARSSGL